MRCYCYIIDNEGSSPPENKASLVKEEFKNLYLCKDF